MDFPPLQESKERRRATRHETRLGAYFLMGSDSFAVNIQVYSATGLLITFERDCPAPERFSGWVGMSACIEASQAALADVLSRLDANDTIDALEPIEGRVVHAEPLGLGIHVEHWP